MSLIALCHRRSIALKIAVAVDEASLNWRLPQPNVHFFHEKIVAQSPGFVLISNEHLEDPTLFTTIRAASPHTCIVVCLVQETVMSPQLWLVLDNLEFDVLCRFNE